ncbi:hypothetical protein MKX03_013935, partial [Papaver bracteatum]
STEDEKQEEDCEKNQRYQFTAEGEAEFEAVLVVPPKTSWVLYEIEHYFSLYLLQGIAGRELLKFSVEFM